MPFFLFISGTKKQSHLQCISACKKTGPAPRTRKMENVNVVLPETTLDRKEKLCFGGFFGRINHVTPFESDVILSNEEMKVRLKSVFKLELSY